MIWVAKVQHAHWTAAMTIWPACFPLDSENSRRQRASSFGRFSAARIGYYSSMTKPAMQAVSVETQSPRQSARSVAVESAFSFKPIDTQHSSSLAARYAAADKCWENSQPFAYYVGKGKCNNPPQHDETEFIEMYLAMPDRSSRSCTSGGLRRPDLYADWFQPDSATVIENAYARLSSDKMV